MEPTITRLPDATRESQMRRWGLVPERLGDGRSRLDNHRTLHPEESRRPVHRADTPEQRAFLQGGGWAAASPGGAYDGGLVAHRGALHPDEYVDRGAVAEAVAERLGATVDQIHAVYRQGPLAMIDRDLRDRIDARLLEVAEAGANVAELGRALGWAVKENGTCRTAENALARARSRRS